MASECAEVFLEQVKGSWLEDCILKMKKKSFGPCRSSLRNRLRPAGEPHAKARRAAAGAVGERQRRVHPEGAAHLRGGVGRRPADMRRQVEAAEPKEARKLGLVEPDKRRELAEALLGRSLEGTLDIGDRLVTECYKVIFIRGG
jgi:hypothetical protein